MLYYTHMIARGPSYQLGQIDDLSSARVHGIIIIIIIIVAIVAIVLIHSGHTRLASYRRDYGHEK
jgi:hypothetical protein